MTPSTLGVLLVVTWVIITSTRRLLVLQCVRSADNRPPTPFTSRAHDHANPRHRATGGRFGRALPPPPVFRSRARHRARPFSASPQYPHSPLRPPPSLRSASSCKHPSPHTVFVHTPPKSSTAAAIHFARDRRSTAWDLLLALCCAVTHGQPAPSLPRRRRVAPMRSCSGALPRTLTTSTHTHT